MKMIRKGVLGPLLAVEVLLESGTAGPLDDGRMSSRMSLRGPTAALAASVQGTGDLAGPTDAVREAQEQLKGAGFDPGPVTGVVHSETREAIRKYQRVKGLPVSGELDDRTRGALRRERVRT
jgi:peptidoglycan hydrolase-like protein with peptidoglycan-binding domain